MTIDDKKMVIAKEILSNKIKFSENRISSLYSITVTVQHPTLSNKFLIIFMIQLLDIQMRLKILKHQKKYRLLMIDCYKLEWI